MTRESGAQKTTGGREEMPDRWSAPHKVDFLLRMQRGKDLREANREIKVLPSVREEWRLVFLERGQQGSKTPNQDPSEQGLIRAQTNLGEITMRLELSNELLRRELEPAGTGCFGFPARDGNPHRRLHRDQASLP